jgi:hypothetical protein
MDEVQVCVVTYPFQGKRNIPSTGRVTHCDADSDLDLHGHQQTKCIRCGGQQWSVRTVISQVSSPLRLQGPPPCTRASSQSGTAYHCQPQALCVYACEQGASAQCYDDAQTLAPWLLQ